MENKVNGRRGFLKGFGLGGVVLSGAAGSYLAATREIPNVASSGVPIAHSNPNDVPAIPPAPDIAHLAPKEGATSLMITGDNRPPPPPPPPAPIVSPFVTTAGSSYVMTGCTSTLYSQSMLSIGSNGKCPDDQLNRVAMAVGKDDRLWIKVGDSWKRVVLEG